MTAAAILVHPDIRAAIRTRLLTLEMVSTGVLTVLSASGYVFSRSAGSFVTDGFAIGDEVMPSGFANSANNARALITALSASAMTVDRALTTEAAGASATIKAQLPQGRKWEGQAYAPTKGQRYISEMVRSIDSTVRALGDGGTISHLLTANFTLNYPSGKGTLGIERMAGALLYLFRPSVRMTYGANSAVITKAERASLLEAPDWLSIPVIITLVAYTSN